MKPITEERIIPLTNGLVALVDEDDFERLRHYRWKARKNPAGRFYAIRQTTSKDRKTVDIYMHREVLGLQKGDPRQGDHRRVEETLDNRKSNLRIATRSQNACNRKRDSRNRTGFKGVMKSGDRYIATISSNGKQMYLGRRRTPEEAYTLYVEAATKLHGEFANLG